MRAGEDAGFDQVGVGFENRLFVKNILYGLSGCVSLSWTGLPAPTVRGVACVNRNTL